MSCRDLSVLKPTFRKMASVKIFSVSQNLSGKCTDLLPLSHGVTENTKESIHNEAVAVRPWRN